MDIGLIDIDSHNFPNLALMKISAYEKRKNNNVEWVNPMKQYDRIYISKIFKESLDFQYNLNANEIIKGGTGYDLKNKLSEEIETICPNYNLYNISNIAYGFLTRGCPRNCKFCIVSEKESNYSYRVANLDYFWSGQKYIKLLDPNLLAYKNHLKLLEQLIKSKACIDFTQGLDCRFLNKENIEKILSCKIKMIHFAWDQEKDENLIINKLELFNKYCNLNQRKKRVYILVNFDTSFEYDLYRINVLKKLNYDPFIMIYDKQNCNQKYRKLQRWINSKFIFYSGKAETFDDYKKISEIKNKNIDNQIMIKGR